MVASDGFAEFLKEQLEPLGRISMRRMFGKTGVVTDELLQWTRAALEAARRIANKCKSKKMG